MSRPPDMIPSRWKTKAINLSFKIAKKFRIRIGKNLRRIRPKRGGLINFLDIWLIILPRIKIFKKIKTSKPLQHSLCAPLRACQQEARLTNPSKYPSKHCRTRLSGFFFENLKEGYLGRIFERIFEGFFKYPSKTGLTKLEKRYTIK